MVTLFNLLVIKLFKLGPLDAIAVGSIGQTNTKTKSSVSNKMTLTNKDSVTLRHGVQMPLVGLGTSHQGGFSHEAIMHAFGIGYRSCVTKYHDNSILGKHLIRN